MTEAGRPPAGPATATGPGQGRRDTLATRLMAGYLGVALAAVAILTGLTVAFAATDVSHLVARQRTQLTAAIAAAAAAGWQRHNSWIGADLSPALDLAARTGADAQILDMNGRPVEASVSYRLQSGMPQYTAAITVPGNRIGEAVVRFTGSGLGSADESLRTALIRAVAISAGLAALVALLTGLAIARRLTRPVHEIISVTRSMGRGERLARVGPVRAPGELREMGSALDQMADKLDRNEQVRRDLVADVAHELRTPVAVLQAGHEALLDGIAEPNPEQLSSLRDEVLRLARMVDDLQTLAAADAAALQLSQQPCDLAQLAAAAADRLAAQFATAGVTLDRRLVPAPIIADPRWIHHVITNLLTNALKFSSAGGQVGIVTRTGSSAAVLEVTDTGMGIPLAELPRIFDRFWRGKQAAHTSGSGIGLAIAAEISRAHGGTLTADSSPGEGTRMTLTLPLAQ
jgi:two-component system sensor histidine kinase BaeS